MPTGRWKRFADRFAEYDAIFQLAFIVLLVALGAVLAFVDHLRH